LLVESVFKVETQSLAALTEQLTAVSCSACGNPILCQLLKIVFNVRLHVM